MWNLHCFQFNRPIWAVSNTSSYNLIQISGIGVGGVSDACIDARFRYGFGFGVKPLTQWVNQGSTV
jgi:hypothetical protein